MTRLICRLCANKVEIHDHCLKCWNNVAKSEAIAALKLVRDQIGYKNNIFSAFFKTCLNIFKKENENE